MDELTKEFVAESQDGLERMELCLTELERRPGDVELVSEIFRGVHTIKGATGFLGFSRLRTLAHTGESVLGVLRDETIRVSSELISSLLALVDGMRAILSLIEATGSEGVRSTDDDSGLIARLTRLRPTSCGKELAAKGQPESVDRDAGRADWLKVPAAVPSIQQRTLRIDVEVLNRMMNLVGELVLTRNRILQCSPEKDSFPELARRLNSVTTELRESVGQARMQPVGHLFGKFPRMVRDLCETCGRRVRIEFEGQDTGLDKSLLEAIRDPLTQAVRNSVDHGIEPPKERVLAGKPVEGVVRLRTFQQNGSVVIEVTDDGAGIPASEILKKAVERGLVTADQAQQMTEREALQLIFAPGISLARTVTNISGRGVGMDVVRANVHRVGGSVEVESQVGSGTTVRMRIPLTLAIIPAFVVDSGGQRFALPQNSVVELVYVPRRDCESAVERVGTAEMFRLRESLLPLVWLDRLLRLKHSRTVEPRNFYIAVLEAGGRRFGLVVDGLTAPEEIVVKRLSRVIREIGIYSGATVLGNGALALILDAASMGTRAGVRPIDEAASMGSTVDGGDARADNRNLQGEESRIEMDHSMVIYETWKRGREGSGRARMGMPLRAVERIERIPLSAIEYAEGRAVLQYDGELLPLEDEDEVLEEMFEAKAAAEVRVLPAGSNAPGIAAIANADAMATVMICTRSGAHTSPRVGIVVRRVLDVSKGTLLTANSELCEGQLAMVKNHVTTIHREFATEAGNEASLQGVA